MLDGMSNLDEILRARRALPEPQRRREIREASGLSLHRIGQEIGVTPAAVALWETGQSMPTPDHLIAYVALLEKLQANG